MQALLFIMTGHLFFTTTEILLPARKFYTEVLPYGKTTED